MGETGLSIWQSTNFIAWYSDPLSMIVNIYRHRVTVNAFVNTPPEPTRTSHTGSRPVFFLFGIVTIAVIVSMDSVSETRTTLLAVGRGPLPFSNVTVAPELRP